METLLDFFTAIPPVYRSLLLICGLALFWILEVAVPLFHFEYGKVRHALLNVFFWATTLAIALGFAS
ncbi:MAG TPA: sterol desaturase, partial [Rhodothermia bacterium]